MLGPSRLLLVPGSTLAVCGTNLQRWSRPVLLLQLGHHLLQMSHCLLQKGRDWAGMLWYCVPSIDLHACCRLQGA